MSNALKRKKILKVKLQKVGTIKKILQRMLNSWVPTPRWAPFCVYEKCINYKGIQTHINKTLYQENWMNCYCSFPELVLFLSNSSVLLCPIALRFSKSSSTKWIAEERDVNKNAYYAQCKTMLRWKNCCDAKRMWVHKLTVHMLVCSSCVCM